MAYLKGPKNTPHKKPSGERRCSGRVGSPCSKYDIRRVTLVTNPVGPENQKVSDTKMYIGYSKLMS
jgi:hypothetical protein